MAWCESVDLCVSGCVCVSAYVSKRKGHTRRKTKNILSAFAGAQLQSHARRVGSGELGDVALAGKVYQDGNSLWAYGSYQHSMLSACAHAQHYKAFK